MGAWVLDPLASAVAAAVSCKDATLYRDRYVQITPRTLTVLRRLPFQTRVDIPLAHISRVRVDHACSLTGFGSMHSSSSFRRGGGAHSLAVTTIHDGRRAVRTENCAKAAAAIRAGMQAAATPMGARPPLNRPPIDRGLPGRTMSRIPGKPGTKTTGRAPARRRMFSRVVSVI